MNTVLITMFRVPFKIFIPACLLLLHVSATAGINEATKAYILGDYEKARYEALIGASDGDPIAQMLMGQLYYNGEGVEKSVELAMYWYEQAARQGYQEAQFRLGTLYFNGSPGIEKDYKKAWEWLSKADDSGHGKVEPMLEILYRQESGEVVNLNESPEVLVQAAESGVLKAKFLLANNLVKAGGTEDEKNRAISMMTDAAKQGFIKAQKRLGEWYLEGLGVEKNYIEAYGWSMAYAGTKALGGIIREGKQAARSSLRNLPQEEHETAYLKSKEYYEQYVLPFHSNAREVGPDKYRIVVNSKVEPKPKPNVPASPAQPAPSANLAPGTTGGVKPPGSQSSNSPVTDGGNANTKSAANSGQNPAPQAAEKDLPGTSQAASVDPNKSGITENGEQINSADATVPSSTSSTVSATVDISVSAEPASSSVIHSGDLASGLENSDSGKAGTTVAEQPAEGQNSTPTRINPEPSQENGVESSNTNSVATAEPIGTTKAETSPVTDSGTVVASAVQTTPRTFEQVFKIFETFLPKINELYLHAYRLDNSLQGSMTVILDIDPSGSVTKVELSSADIQSPDFEQQLEDYLKTLNFGAQNAPQFLFTYQLVLLPK